MEQAVSALLRKSQPGKKAPLALHSPRGTREGQGGFGEQVSSAGSKVSVCLQPEQVLGEEAGREGGDVPAALLSLIPNPLKSIEKLSSTLIHFGLRLLSHEKDILVIKPAAQRYCWLHMLLFFNGSGRLSLGHYLRLINNPCQV